MDLKNQTITLRELLADPRSKAVLQRRFGVLLEHPMVSAALPMTLKQLSLKAVGHLPLQTIRDIIRELQAL